MKGKIRGEGEKSRYFLEEGIAPYREVTKAEYLKHFPDQPLSGGTFGGTPTKGWPISSRALAYHPKQVEEARAHLAKIGEPTEVKDDGSVVLTDRGHRKRLLKALNMHDNEAGYGD